MEKCERTSNPPLLPQLFALHRNQAANQEGTERLRRCFTERIKRLDLDALAEGTDGANDANAG